MRPIEPLIADNGIVARFHTSIESTSPTAWSRLLPGQAEDWHYFRAVERSPPPGFQLGVILASRGSVLVGAAPVFRTSYRFDTSFQGSWRRISEKLYSRIPWLVSMDALSLGSPLSDNSHLGLVPHLPSAERQQVLGAMLKCLAEQATKDRVALIAAKSCMHAGGR